jgi:dUTPase
VIDNSYATDMWCVDFYATQDVVIPKGKRLVQFRIQKEQPQINFTAVQSLSSQSRGGYGSTGK